MESNIVHDFQNLRVFSNRNNRMDELVHDLTTALEETSKGIRSECNQENSISTGTVGRVRHHKRRRGTRRAAANIYWKRGTISEASESSIDEAIRDCIDNSVITHSDSDDLALTYPKHRLAVPMADPVPAVESDSFTENLSPLRPQRRRRRYKHMAVDTSEALSGPLDISGVNENSNSNSTVCSQTPAMAIPSAAPVTSGQSTATVRVTRSHRANTGSSRGSSMSSASRAMPQNVVPGKRKRSSKRHSEGMMEARAGASDKDSVDLDNMEMASPSQESSSLSSSELDSDVYTNADEGREADDEQSDFFHEGGPTYGIPAPLIKWWENESSMDSGGATSRQEFDNILKGALAHMPNTSQRSFRHRVEKMIARAENGREIKIGRRKLKGKIPCYTMKRFLQDRESWNMMQSGCHFSPGASWNSGYSSQSGDYKRLRQTPPLPDSAEEGFVGEHAIPIPESNIGNKMLQTMGWTPGSGLGVERDGRQDPVVAYRRRGRKGLGYETQSDT